MSFQSVECIHVQHYDRSPKSKGIHDVANITDTTLRDDGNLNILNDGLDDLSDA